MDTNYNETQTIILEAFSTLLDKKVYEEITINEISKISFLSRTTIYRYFKDKDDIAREYILNILNRNHADVFSDVLKTRLTSLKNSRISQYLKESDEFRRLFFSIRELNITSEFDELDEVTKSFITGGICITIRNWTMSNFEKDVDVLTNEIINRIHKLTK